MACHSAKGHTPSVLALAEFRIIFDEIQVRLWYLGMTVSPQALIAFPFPLQVCGCDEESCRSQEGAVG